MANPEHVEIVKQGRAAIAKWRKERPCEQIDLSGACLIGVRLAEVDLSFGIFRDTNFRDADLQGANLTGTDFSYASLMNANLCRSNMERACLRDANLRLVNLCGANLAGANLWGANLTLATVKNCNLCDAHFGYTAVDTTDIALAQGVESVQHDAPSFVSVDSAHASKIPEAFLRGCGVPDALIAYLPSLLGTLEPIQFYSCFISYSTKDEEFCKRLRSRMRDEKMRVWFAPEDIQGGKKLHEQIDDAIRLHEKLLLVLTENSMASDWVKTEVRKALRREASEGKRVLFPIRLVPFDAIRDWEAFDADTGTDMAVKLREYFIPDFSNWKDLDEFEAAFKRLLNDLKADKMPKEGVK